MDSSNRAADYNDLITSSSWKDTLQDLNDYIVDNLARAGEPAVINGNLFYKHLERDFHNLPLNTEFESKRRNFFELARRSTCLFEIGVNAGHSMLLALMANPELKCVGLDVCERLNQRWARVDIYVPAAFNWLRYKFGDRVELIKGNSLIETPRFQLENPDATVDFLHLDGSKDTHLREAIAIGGLMPTDGFVVHDDFQMRNVRVADRQLRRINFSKPLDYQSNGLVECDFHIIRAKV
ncbi:class I SAM-dependent methyltransferase [Ruegeria arenilitoris]|uniref:class I SAM-dependent methyltransferase n=1 Tax=Ruegeria arenilitoris TaxID=1173585 RepID=UPI001480DD2B|nr:class I SAM-dependent methyltransferase [Ruegeria arenilitoris]